MKKPTKCKLLLIGFTAILMVILFSANASALLYDFIYVDDLSCSLLPGWGIMPMYSVGLVANTGATNITAADFRTLTFNVQSSVPGITLTIFPLYFADPAAFCPLLPGETVGLVLPDQNGISFNSLLLNQVQQNEHLKNGSILICQIDREVGNTFVGDVYFDITMTMSNEEVSFRVVMHMDLPAQGSGFMRFNSADRTGLAKKITLGKSVSAFVPTPSKYKVYVPSRYGGKLQVKTSAGEARLFYPDFNTAVSSSTANLSYEVPKDKFGWYYIKVSSATTNYTISNTFYEEGEVTPDRKPWNISTWWPPSDVFDDGNSIGQIKNTYDEILPKYDTVVGLSGTNSATEWEKRYSFYSFGRPPSEKGHYIYNGKARETHAEKDFKYDWNNNRQIEDPGPFDFCDDTGTFRTPDGDLNDFYDTTWWGHCDGWCRAAIIYKDPEDLTMQNGFIAEEVKALFTELGMATYISTRFPDPINFPVTESKWTKKFHEFIQKFIGEEKKTIYGDLKSSERMNANSSQVWNHPIWYYKAEMAERQNIPEDEKLVDVKLTLKAADDTGKDFREDSDRSDDDKKAEYGYGAHAWLYHLLFENNGYIADTGNGWDTSDEYNNKWYITYLSHPDSFYYSYPGNPNVSEDGVRQNIISGPIQRTDW